MDIRKKCGIREQHGMMNRGPNIYLLFTLKGSTVPAVGETTRESSAESTQPGNKSGEQVVLRTVESSPCFLFKAQ